MTSVLAAGPLCILPTKDSIEELIYGDKEMTMKQNLVVTFILLVIAGTLGIIVPDIGTAM